MTLNSLGKCLCVSGGLFCIELISTHQGTEFTSLYLSLVLKWRNDVKLLQVVVGRVYPTLFLTITCQLVKLFVAALKKVVESRYMKSGIF